MALPEDLTECLNIRRIEMATEVNNVQYGMKAYVVIFPMKEVKAQKYKTNLLPVVSYEVRIVMHKDLYTDEEWGLDYDYVLDDTTTRIKRIFVNRTDDNQELEQVLRSLPIDVNNFFRTSNFNSALVNSPIECYLENMEERPHLWNGFTL